MADRRLDAGFDVVVDDRPVRIALRRSARARRYTLRFTTAGDFVLTMPVRGSEDRAVAFATAQRRWIGSRVGRIAAPVPFEDGAVIPLRGEPHAVRHAGTSRGLVSLAPADGGGLPLIRVAGDPAHLSRRLADWLKSQARADLEVAARRHAEAAGVTVARIAVRDQATRWGSCSAAGTLSFSWRLVLAPPTVLDYLAAHEVAHRVEMNHGPRFWSLTRRLAPHTDQAEAWLKRHGAGLHRYGPR